MAGDEREEGGVSTQREIFWAVKAAIDAGMTVEQFRQECAEVWDAILTEKRESDARAWREVER